MGVPVYLLCIRLPPVTNYECASNPIKPTHSSLRFVRAAYEQGLEDQKMRKKYGMKATITIHRHQLAP
jgi:hypothetical protein